MKPRLITAIFLLLGMYQASLAETTTVEIAKAEDLAQLGQDITQKRAPALLVFVADGCPFCIEVEEDFLKPMLRSGDYDDKVLIRKVKIDEYHDMNDFDGKPLSPQKLQARYDVFVTPTLVFVDAQGKEIAERLTGINTRDYYGAYLDRSIGQGLKALRNDQQ